MLNHHAATYKTTILSPLNHIKPSRLRDRVAGARSSQRGHQRLLRSRHRGTLGSLTSGGFSEGRYEKQWEIT
jgi:hypothetical protein